MWNPSILTSRLSLTCRHWVIPVMCFGLCGSWPERAGALSIYTLSSGNSSMNINVASSTGAYHWIVDGRDQLKEDSLSYRIGNAGPDLSITSIGSPKAHQPTGSALDTVYSNTRLSVQEFVSLWGGAPGSGVAGFSDQLTIQNLTPRALDFHFFQYASFDSYGVAQFEKNAQGLVDEASITGPGGPSAEQIDTVLTPGANRAALRSASLGRASGSRLRRPTAAGSHPPMERGCWSGTA